MKNKKIVFGIILLFAITGICNIQNVSAFTDTVYIPPSSYAWYSVGYLDVGDKLLINEIDSDGGIDILIMNGDQFYEFDGHSYSCEWEWKDIKYLSGWIFQVYENSAYYHIILWNKELLTERTVYVDISIEVPEPEPEPSRPGIILIEDILIYYVLPIVAVVIAIISIIVVIILSRKHKKKIPKEIVIIQGKIAPKIIYCQECDVRILDQTKEFCSTCGVKINK